MLPWVAWELVIGAKVQMNLAGALAILYSAVCSQLLAYLGWSHVVMRLGAGLAGLTLHLMPAMGVVLSALFLSEYPGWFHFFGIALILLGVTLSTGRARICRIPTQERMQ
jgi:drug/metabolite transporter (DMT)-like permease